MMGPATRRWLLLRAERDHSDYSLDDDLWDAAGEAAAELRAEEALAPRAETDPEDDDRAGGGGVMDRFIVIDTNDERVQEDERGDFGWCILDTSTGKIVGQDGGEPEDQLLMRDWSWVAPLLNKVDQRAEAAEAENAKLRALLRALPGMVLAENEGGPFTAEEVATALAARIREVVGGE